MKDTVRYIFYIVLILAISIGATYFGRYVNRKFLGIERHDETIKSLRDSLNSFIKKYDTIINEQQFVIDSLRGIKQKLLLFMRKLKVILMIVISLVMIPFSAISQKDTRLMAIQLLFLLRKKLVS